MLIEIHMLKNYPATNLNRDDSGAPKTCYFGGVQRGRISSQCQKRSWRTSPLFAMLESQGWRSRALPELVAAELADLPEKAVIHAKKLISTIGTSAKTQEKKAAKEEQDTANNAAGKTPSVAASTTGQLIFFSPADVKALAEAVRAIWQENGESVPAFEKVKKSDALSSLVKNAAPRAITLDIALFGRMTTSQAFVDVESAMQVAHAVSTHAVNLESDYFTAVDDLLGADSPGAGMIGDIDFDSCCYYQYASLDMDKLRENLKNSPEAQARVGELLPVLLQVMAETNPSGKQNSFAGHVMPEAVMVEFKTEKIPLNYANAFAEPVSRYSTHIAKDSIDKLAGEIDLMDDCYALPVAHRAWMALRSENQPKHCERFRQFRQLCEACAQWARE